MRDLFAGSSPRSIRTAEQAGMARTWKGIPSTVLWHFALIVCLLLRFRLQMRHDLALTTAYAKCTGRDPRIDPQIQAISLLISNAQERRRNLPITRRTCGWCHRCHWCQRCHRCQLGFFFSWWTSAASESDPGLQGHAGLHLVFTRGCLQISYCESPLTMLIGSWFYFIGEALHVVAVTQVDEEGELKKDRTHGI